MEWPTIDILSSSEDDDFLTSEDKAYLQYTTSTLITKEIYARAAKAAVANILVDHEESGLRARVEAFLEHLRSSDDDNWNTEYRAIAREFSELMACAKPRSRVLEICRAGLDAVHDLLKYRLPQENGGGSGGNTVLAAKDAFVLCQSFNDKLHTNSVTGTRAPDLDFRFGLWTKTPKYDDFAEAHEYTLYGQDACSHVYEMRNKGQLETSAASLAGYTVTNSNLVARLAKKHFVVIGCDHALSPTRSLLQIPGVTVLGVPSGKRGLQHVLRYATYNTPDDTSFVYPSLTEESDGDDGNLVLSRAPHIAQWILEQTNDAFENLEDDSEIVLVPMPLPGRFTEEAVRWEAATDLIVQRILRARSDSMKCSVWSYQSSTTCMVVPSASNIKSTELLKNRPSHEKLLHGLSLGTILTPIMNDGNPSPSSASESTPSKQITDPNVNHHYSIVNGILALEGPHHVLAQHIRMWRAMVTNYPDDFYNYRDDDSDDEDDMEDDPSKNIYIFAPYTPLTSDLVANESSHFLDPVEVFDPGASASLLCAIALAGLVDPIINRPLPVFEEESNDVLIEPSTPFAMFWNGSFHGGIWNCPYTLNSASGPSGYLLGKAYEYYRYYSGSSAPKQEGDNSSSAKGDNSNKSIVDLVPSQHELPDIVKERLKMMDGP